MAALNRPTEANYEVHENVRVDTQDNEDHTFCGIMFPIKAKQDVPVNKIFLHSVAVRGELGPLTVWVSKPHIRPAENTRDYRFPLQKNHWDKIYEKTHEPSMREYQWLDFSQNPIELEPGQVRAIYIHSTAPGDEAIVYDNANIRRQWQYGPPGHRGGTTEPRYQDAFVSIHTGKAHLSPRPFGQTPIWGWGNSWRDHREFVGQIRYGVRYQLWQPALTGTKYGPAFRSAVQTMLGCQRRSESPVAYLPDECLYYIFNMCRWDWWNDQASALQEQRRRLRSKARNQMEASSPPTNQLVQKVTEEIESMEESQRDMDDGEEEADDDDDNVSNNTDDQDMNEEDEDEWQEEDDENEDNSDSEESEWEAGYRADTHVFAFRDVSSSEESDADSDEDPEAAAVERQAWFRRHFARIHILRALAQADNGNDAVVGGSDMESSDDDGEALNHQYETLVDTDED